MSWSNSRADAVFGNPQLNVFMLITIFKSFIIMYIFNGRKLVSVSKLAYDILRMADILCVTMETGV